MIAETKPKLRPMLFSTPMIKALLNGSKTQTRRIVKPQPIDNTEVDGNFFAGDHSAYVKVDGHPDWQRQFAHQCAPVQVGDVIWVRETWRIILINPRQPSAAFYTVQFKDYAALEYNKVAHLQAELKAKFKTVEEGATGIDFGVWRPSLFMPFEVCRIFLKVTHNHVERLQDIPEADAVAEGIEVVPVGISFGPNDTRDGVRYHDYSRYKDSSNPNARLLHTAVASYASLWKKINGPESWAANPYVFVYTFQRTEKPCPSLR